MSIAYRSAAPSDVRFIEESWLDSYKTAHAAGMVSFEDWRAVMLTQIRKALARPNVAVTVAYHPGETDHTADLYGWISVEWGHRVPYVQYLYVKHAYREMRIGKTLFTKAQVRLDRPWEYACRTSALSKDYFKPYLTRARWNPLLIRIVRSKDVEGSASRAD